MVFFGIPRIFLEQKLIYNGYLYMYAFSAGKMSRFMTQSTYFMTSLRQSSNSFPYTAKFVFDGVRCNTTQQIRQ